MSEPLKFEQVKDLEVLSETGEKIPLGTLHGEGPTILAFVRHFG